MRFDQMMVGIQIYHACVQENIGKVKMVPYCVIYIFSTLHFGLLVVSNDSTEGNILSPVGITV